MELIRQPETLACMPSAFRADELGIRGHALLAVVDVVVLDPSSVDHGPEHNTRHDMNAMLHLFTDDSEFCKTS